MWAGVREKGNKILFVMHLCFALCLSGQPVNTLSVGARFRFPFFVFVCLFFKENKKLLKKRKFLSAVSFVFLSRIGSAEVLVL